MVLSLGQGKDRWSLLSEPDPASTRSALSPSRRVEVAEGLSSTSRDGITFMEAAWKCRQRSGPRVQSLVEARLLF